MGQHVNLEASPAVAGSVEGLKLDAMRNLCDVLGDPQDAQPAIHITGTNGKGSVARMATALLGAHDLTVGTFTSPDLESINERLARNGEAISDDQLAAVLSDLAALEPLLDHRPSRFEILVGAALRWFSDEAVQAAVIEVGLLGRWDATNVVDGAVAVLTNVGYDHTDGVGDWRRRIAEEKAGIVKPGATFVLGETDPHLADVFAATPAATIWKRGVDFECTRSVVAVGGRVLDLRTPFATYDELYLPLHGEHQVDNAAVAVVAVEAFFERALDPDVVDAALRSVRTPGRFEVVGHDPLVVLDGAHNPDGARAAATTLDEEFVTTGDLRLVVGVLSGRDPHELLERLGAGRAAEVVCCAPDSPRALPVEDLAAAVRDVGGHPRVARSVEEAVRSAVGAAGEDDAVLISGSLYTVGAARTACRSIAGLTVS